jgi:hypothetical protein
MPWNDEIVHGFTDIQGEMEPVTFKEKADGAGEITDVLIAPGHVPDIQPDVNHVHAWAQNTDNPAHHDLRPPDAGWMPG